MPKKATRPNKTARKRMETDLTAFFFPPTAYDGLTQLRRPYSSRRSMSYCERPPLPRNLELEIKNLPGKGEVAPASSAPAPAPEPAPPAEEPLVEPPQSSESEPSEPPQPQNPEAEAADPVSEPLQEDIEDQKPSVVSNLNEKVVDKWEELDVSDAEIEGNTDHKPELEHPNTQASPTPPPEAKEEEPIKPKPLLSEVLAQRLKEEQAGFTDPPPTKPSGFPPLSPERPKVNLPLPFPRSNPFANPPSSSSHSSMAASRGVGGVLRRSSPCRQPADDSPSSPQGGFSVHRPPNSFGAPPGQLANLRLLAQSLNIAPIPPGQHAFNQMQSQNITATQKTFNNRWDELAAQSSPYQSKFSTSSSSWSNTGSPFDKKPDKLPNPFAARKRYTADPFDTTTPARSTQRSSFASGGIGGGGGGQGGFSDGFSTSKYNQYRGVSNDRLEALGSNGRDGNPPLPSWWKSRSFSSSSSFLPSKSHSRSLTTMNVPSHGNIDDVDQFAKSANFQQSYRKPDLMAKKERWARMKAKKRLLRRPVEDNFFHEEDEDEEMFGKAKILNPLKENQSGHFENYELNEKFARDIAYVKEVLLKEVDGNLEQIRELRFLIASVQTYGNIDGKCMVAEIGMNEFTLLTGILERFHAIVGPWAVESETQRRRASRHAFETHKIPLQHNFATISKRKLVEEILGRTEPSIAYRQGVKVGLYSDTCDEQFRVHLHLKNKFQDPAMVVDSKQRRFILVLQSEYELMIDSFKHLGKSVGLQYGGFPTTPERFIFVEAFVEAITNLLGEVVTPETTRWFGVLGQKANVDSSTPWEKTVELHCDRHMEPKNNFCAQVTVCRCSFIILHILGTFFRKYHLKKYPICSSSVSLFGTEHS